MRVALIAKKGGVGKSTLSLLLHTALRQAGRTVSLIDWDIQGTSTKSLALLGQPTGVENAEICIYDTPPSLDHPATATAIRNSSLCLVVTSPSPADVWEAEEAVRFAAAANPNAAVRVVFNKVRKGTLLGRLADESARLVSAPTLGPSVSARECYQHAAVQGWRALDGPAREEVLQLALAVLAQPR
jgi:MinD-like ATPase involved in chromosome partitioning or flagellar assembly